MYIWHLGMERQDIGERARGPRCECSRCTDSDTVKEKYISATFSDYDNIDPKETKELSEHQYMLCMSHMFGFILKDRTYGKSAQHLVRAKRRRPNLCSRSPRCQRPSRRQDRGKCNRSTRHATERKQGHNQSDRQDIRGQRSSRALQRRFHPRKGRRPNLPLTRATWNREDAHSWYG
jgi:arylamine N-acetyltransferase